MAFPFFFFAFFLYVIFLPFLARKRRILLFSYPSSFRPGNLVRDVFFEEGWQLVCRRTTNYGYNYLKYALLAIRCRNRTKMWFHFEWLTRTYHWFVLLREYYALPRIIVAGNCNQVYNFSIQEHDDWNCGIHNNYWSISINTQRLVLDHECSIRTWHSSVEIECQHLPEIKVFYGRLYW